MAVFLRVNGITHANRFEVTARVIEAVQGAGGWIVNHQAYSNLALCINFEIERGRVRDLARRLEGTGLEILEESQVAMAQASKGNASDNVPGTLQASFVHEEPDVKVYPPPG